MAFPMNSCYSKSKECSRVKAVILVESLNSVRQGAKDLSNTWVKKTPDLGRELGFTILLYVAKVMPHQLLLVDTLMSAHDVIPWVLTASY